RTEMVRFLLAHGADARIESKQFSAMCYAALRGRTQIVKELLAHGASPNETFGIGRVSLLYVTINNEHLETAKVLIRHSADPSHLLKHGNPLHAAAELGSLDLVRKLLKGGADPNPSENKPITAAAAKGHDDILRVLLSAGADVNSTNAWG